MIFIYLFIYTSMGAYQTLAALARLLIAGRSSSSYAIHLKRYLLIVCAYFLLLYGIQDIEFDGLFFSYLFVIPWFIAVWHLNKLRIYSSLRKNVRDFDKMADEARAHSLRQICKHPKRKVIFKGLKLVQRTDNEGEEAHLVLPRPSSLQTIPIHSIVSHQIMVSNDWIAIIED